MLAASNKTWQNPLKFEVSQPRLIFTSNSSFNDAKQIRAQLSFSDIYQLFSLKLVTYVLYVWQHLASLVGVGV